MKKYYYHFTGDRLRDGRPIPAKGQWLKHDGEIVPCLSGLHASEHPYDALAYAPGAQLHLVELGDEIQTHGDPVDKVVSNKRKIVATVEATEMLRKFARACALDCLKYWKSPVPEMVKQYLETGDESKRGAARSAAGAAESAAWAARSAAGAAESAARSAARSAAGAAESAAWAARSAAESAAWAARSAAESARSAWAAACSKHKEIFKCLVEEAFKSVLPSAQ